jgi:phage virion morphogenesis protein
MALNVNLRDLERLNAAIANAATGSLEQLGEPVGQILEDGARERLESLKSAPDGSPWPAWSERYAKTVSGGQSLLDAEGDLIDSISSEAQSETVLVGSNLPYAGVHNEGWPEQNIPARQYLGISEDEAERIGIEIGEWYLGLLQ